MRDIEYVDAKGRRGRYSGEVDEAWAAAPLGVHTASGAVPGPGPRLETTRALVDGNENGRWSWGGVLRDGGRVPRGRAASALGAHDSMGINELLAEFLAAP